jgi:hypothetical protein
MLGFLIRRAAKRNHLMRPSSSNVSMALTEPPIQNFDSEDVDNRVLIVDVWQGSGIHIEDVKRR